MHSLGIMQLDTATACKELQINLSASIC